MAHVRSDDTVASALRASDAGVPDADNARIHGVAVKTIRRWRRLYQRRGVARGQAHTAVPCPRCEDGLLDQVAYAELLGWYLGDGHVSLGRRQVFNFHICNDVRYPRLNAHILDLMRAVKPGGRPHTRLIPGCVVTTVSWKHWPCLLPQHGPGKKHERTIALEGWQRDITHAHPADFLRGLFHSDGSRFFNRVKGRDYPRWMFVNASDDILDLCTEHLDLVGIAWRRTRVNCLAVSRRADVARLDALIGLKG